MFYMELKLKSFVSPPFRQSSEKINHSTACHYFKRSVITPVHKFKQYLSRRGHLSDRSDATHTTDIITSTCSGRLCFMTVLSGRNNSIRYSRLCGIILSLIPARIHEWVLCWVVLFGPTAGDHSCYDDGEAIMNSVYKDPFLTLFSSSVLVSMTGLALMSTTFNGKEK